MNKYILPLFLILFICNKNILAQSNFKSAGTEDTIKTESPNSSLFLLLQDPVNIPGLSESEFSIIKELIIHPDSIRKTWLTEKVAINKNCDSFIFQDVSYNQKSFTKAIGNFIITKSVSDTVLFQLDFGQHLSLDIFTGMLRIMGKLLEDRKIQCTYWVTMYQQPVKKETETYSDTIDISIKKEIMYNDKSVNNAELLNLLNSLKPAKVLIMVDKNLKVQDLAEIMADVNITLHSLNIKSKIIAH